MSPPTVTLWRDIASAPKKARVLLWLSAPRLGENVWPGRMMLDSFTDKTGWYIETPLGLSEDAPTHWQPMPPPPTEAGSAALNTPPRERTEAALDLAEAALRAAHHALRSYQYGNASPDLADDVADRVEKALGFIAELRKG